MSTVTTVPLEGTDTGEGSTATSPTVRSVWRSWRGSAVIGLIVVLTAVIGVALSGGGSASRYLDPADSGLDGSKGLAQLLRGRGVTVHRVTMLADATALARPGTLLVVTGSAIPDGAASARDLASLPADRLVIGFTPYLDILAPGVADDEPIRTRSREPACDLPQATLAGSAYMGGATFTSPEGAMRCYLASGKPSLVSYRQEFRTITVVGDGQFMTNLRLAEDGNAALALNLTGRTSTVIWLTDPAPGDPGYAPADGLAGPEGKTLYDLIPGGVGWAAVQLALAVLLVAFWRGRRLGPVVAERLPVVVRAAETVEGRGRLYRARRARDRASAALRAAALDRMTPRLGLSRDATPDEILAALAMRTGDGAARLRFDLYGPAPTDDPGLVSLADRLDAVERRVRLGIPTDHDR